MELMRPNFRLLLFLILMPVILLSVKSCSSARKAGADVRVKKLSTAKMEAVISGHNNPYDWFSGKARVVVEDNDMRIGGTIQIRMLRNEFIWMSIQKFGFEVARAYIRPDSAFVIDRFNRDYYAESLDDYLTAYHIPFRFEELQGLFLGNIPYQKGRRPRYRLEAGTHYLTQVTPDNLFFEYQFGADQKLHQMLVKDPMDRRVTSQLGEYVKTSGRDVPLAIAHFVEAQEEKLGMSIDYSSVEFDVEKKIPFEIPSHYTRIQ